VLGGCGWRTVSSSEIVLQPEKKESLHFDPELFSSEGDVLAKRIIETVITANSYPQYSKVQGKGEEKQGEENDKLQKLESMRSMDEEKEISNIVKVRLEGTQAMVYCPYKCIKKQVNVQIRPLFVSSIGIITIAIEINKTIESLKREIF
jgi:hypothetical protein